MRESRGCPTPPPSILQMEKLRFRGPRLLAFTDVQAKVCYAYSMGSWQVTLGNKSGGCSWGAVRVGNKGRQGRDHRGPAGPTQECRLNCSSNEKLHGR